MADEEYTSFDDLYGPVGADIPIQHSHASTGLWLDPNFPKRGWTINDHFDRGHDGLEPCQVCEVTPVRYALVMEHPDWPEILEAGCVCAGYMIGDKQTAEVSYRKAVAEAKKQPGYQKRAYNRRPSVETF